MPTLADLIDLSLGTPQVGAVNFTVLHTVLHQMLKEMGIGGKSVDHSEFDHQLLKTQEAAPASTEVAADGGAGSDTVTAMTSSRPPYHAMMTRINQLEKRLELLDSPDDKLVNKDVMIIKEHGGPGQKPVSDMWTLMQTKRKAQMNEDMITKLSSMMEDLLTAHNRAKADNEILKNKINGFTALAEELSKTNEDLKKRVEELQLKEEKNRMDIDELQIRMKSTEDNLERVNTRMETISKDFSVFVTKDDLKQYATKSEFQKSIQELQDLLAAKANQSDLETIQQQLANIPLDLLEQLEQLARNLDTLRLDRDNDAELLRSLEDGSAWLRREIEQLQTQCKFLMDEGKQTRKNLIEIDARVQTLDLVKADKETIQIEIDLKADKRTLDGKVGRTIFDDKTGEIDEEIGKLRLRLGGCEDDYKNAIDELLRKLDDKLDKSEISALKEWLEDKLAKLKPKLIKQEFRIDGDLDDAAGFRK